MFAAGLAMLLSTDPAGPGATSGARRRFHASSSDGLRAGQAKPAPARRRVIEKKARPLRRRFRPLNDRVNHRAVVGERGTLDELVVPA